MDTFTPTDRTRIRRVPARGSYDRATLHAILDEGLVASVGFVVEGQPYVIPMVYARRGDQLYLHGAMASRLLKQSAVPLCVTVTLVDGLVLARSAFHHSMNYRSAVVLGEAREVTDAGERSSALAAVVDHVLAGRSQQCRPPNDKELRATRVLALPIDEASAKARTGGPLDDDDDLPLPFWGGHLPLHLVAGAPVPDGRAAPVAPTPSALLSYLRRRSAP
jgi:nitroimidazol reductase NimA-like FMN-containing flavoprotein (pyridoxamine 5'-phosphate oxidase superfamily)